MQFLQFLLQPQIFTIHVPNLPVVSVVFLFALDFHHTRSEFACSFCSFSFRLRFSPYTFQNCLQFLQFFFSPQNFTIHVPNLPVVSVVFASALDFQYTRSKTACSFCSFCFGLRFSLYTFQNRLQFLQFLLGSLNFNLHILNQPVVSVVLLRDLRFSVYTFQNCLQFMQFLLGSLNFTLHISNQPVVSVVFGLSCD